MVWSLILHLSSGCGKPRVKDRFVGETVRSIFDLEWNFVFSCLEAFGFGPEFIWWVRTLYDNIDSCVINNGLATLLKFYWEIGQCQKPYKHLVFQRSFIHWKVTIIKSFLIPKFVYISSLLPVPQEIDKELNKMIFKFLWKRTD